MSFLTYWMFWREFVLSPIIFTQPQIPNGLCGQNPIQLPFTHPLCCIVSFDVILVYTVVDLFAVRDKINLHTSHLQDLLRKFLQR